MFKFERQEYLGKGTVINILNVAGGTVVGRFMNYGVNGNWVLSFQENLDIQELVFLTAKLKELNSRKEENEMVAKIQEWFRSSEYSKGQCTIITRGDYCECFLCLLDKFLERV